MFSDEVTILIIDDNSPFVLPLIRSFSGYKNVHLDVLLISTDRRQQFRYSRHLRNLYYHANLTRDNFLEVVTATVKKSGADLIVPTREWISALLYLNKKTLEEVVAVHPVPSTDTLAITGNKWNLNQWLENNELPCATVKRIDNEWNGRYPVLLKPTQGIGGEGIQMLHNEDDLNRVQDDPEINEENYLLQEYITGFDIDCSLFAFDGKILFYTIQRGIVSGSLTYSKGIEFIKNRELYNLVETIIGELDYTGIAHLDFRYSEVREEYILIDFNARYWSSVQGSRTMGVNFPLLVTAFSLGLEYDYTEYRTGYFYFTSTAIRVKCMNLFRKKKYHIKLKDTQVLYSFRDPLPELIFFIRYLLSPFYRLMSKFKSNR